MLGVTPLDQAHVQGDSGGERELGQEAVDQIAGHAADVRGREIEVGDQARSLAQVEGDMGERLGRGNVCAAVPLRAAVAKQRRERAPERLPGGGDLRVGAARPHSERQLEATVGSELLE